MAKDPAFLFYPNDWLGGTLGMTFEEKGAYMELLMLQYNRGHMTSHMIGQVVGQIWDKIRSKFVQDPQGLWYNIRLDEEKNKRKRFTDSRKNNRTGKNQHTGEGGHMTSHMENANENINKGGAGGKWNTRPGPEEMNLPLDPIRGGAVVELFKFTKNHDLTNSELAGLWSVFKAQNFTGEKFYKSPKETYSHFINWSKTQNISKAQVIPLNGSNIKTEDQIDWEKYK